MISHDDVRRIADLARLEVTAEEVDAVHGKLAAIFGLIDELAAVDTTGIEPMAHVLDAVLPLREDTRPQGGPEGRVRRSFDAADTRRLGSRRRPNEAVE